LLAKAVGQVSWVTQADRIRGQARSYAGCCVGRFIKAGHGPVGAGLLAKAVGKANWMTSADRIRREPSKLIRQA
jgi:hypothetical protein